MTKPVAKLRILVVVHVYYRELWRELADCIRHVDGRARDLVITYSDDSSVAVARKDFPEAKFVRCEDVGYDIWPFIKVLQSVDLDAYDVVVKLHTKRDLPNWQDARPFNGFLVDGPRWRRQLLRFVSTEDAWRQTVSRLRGPLVGMVADDWVIVRERGVRFVAGTMFAARAAALKAFQSAEYTAERFAPADDSHMGSFAHTCERRLGAEIAKAGLKIVGYGGGGMRFQLMRCMKKLWRFVFHYKVSSAGRLLVKILKVPVFAGRLKRNSHGQMVFRVLGLPVRLWDPDAVHEIERSRYFDADYYRAHAVRPFGRLSPALHYLKYGVGDGVDPSDSFSSLFFDCVYNGRPTRKCGLLQYVRGSFGSQSCDWSSAEFERQRIGTRDIAEARALRLKGIPVLLVSHEFSRTGAPMALIEMATRLSAMGFAPLVLSLQGGPMSDECVRRGIACRVSWMANGSFRRVLGDDGALFKEYLACFDVILFSTIVSAAWVECYRPTAAKLLCWAHEGNSGFDNCDTSHLRRCLRMFDRVYTGGEYARRVMRERCGDDLQVESVLYGVEDLSARYSSRRAGGKLRFVLAGTIDRRKGQDVLLKALDLLPTTTLSQIEIAIIGRATDEAARRLIAFCRHPCVTHIPEMPLSELLQTIADCDVLMCPSLDDPMPTVATYAMMFSKAVIVSDCTGTAALLSHGESGFVVEAGDAGALAKIIDAVVRDRDRLPAIGAAAREVYRKNFTMAQFDANLQRMFNGGEE